MGSFVLGLTNDTGVARIEIAARRADSTAWQRVARCAGTAIEWVDAGAWLRAAHDIDAPVDQLRIVIIGRRKSRIALARVAILRR
jgi:hypothetical protein